MIHFNKSQGRSAFAFPLTKIGCVFLLAATGCAHIPKNPDKMVSYSHDPAQKGMLAATSKAVLEKRDENDSGFMLIQKNSDALRWRLALIDSAQKSIDLQVFIWSNDESGRLMLNRLVDASRRGVKVRLLIDDLPKDWSDRITAIIARMPNIAIRRFNPGRVRKGIIGRVYQMSTQFKSLNRRMHNKQLIVDGTWGILGSRNLGNPYFGLSTKYNNRDLDLLITGAVVPDMAEDFDEYWNSDAAYPGEVMAGELSGKELDETLARYRARVEKDHELLKQTCIPIEPLNWTAEFKTLPSKMVLGTAECLQDSPEVKGDRGVRLVEKIYQAELEFPHTTSVVTPYMIPSKQHLEAIQKAVLEENRTMRFLVPSMESNNHTMAHSHYKKYRNKLLMAGAELYEFRGQPSAELRALSDTPPVKSEFISLHTKAFVLDEHWVLLGSLNIDPRSIKINTEHMLIIDCPALAEQILADFETMIAPENAYAVTLDEKNDLRWSSINGDRKIQPARSHGQRWKGFFWRWMPIEGQL